jgi:GNAT superfamily N-acetyltransferase
MVAIRPAEPGDELAVACVHVRSWQRAYRGLMPDEYLDQLRPEDRADRYDFACRDPKMPHTILATERETVLGFATASRSRDADLPDYGELCALYVDPSYWGQGFGVALMRAVRTQMSQTGFTEALLWLLVGNRRAARFYKLDQWMPDHSRRASQVWGLTVDEVRYTTSLKNSTER